MTPTPYVQPSDIERRIDRLTDEVAAISGTRPFHLTDILKDRIPYQLASSMRGSEAKEALEFYEVSLIQELNKSFIKLMADSILSNAHFHGFCGAGRELEKILPAPLLELLIADEMQALNRIAALTPTYEGMRTKADKSMRRLGRMGKLESEKATLFYTMIPETFGETAPRVRHRLLRGIGQNCLEIAYQCCAMMDITVSMQALRIDFGLHAKDSPENADFVQATTTSISWATAFANEAENINHALVKEAPLLRAAKMPASNPQLRASPLN